jgi:hypothetical protein
MLPKSQGPSFRVVPKLIHLISGIQTSNHPTVDHQFPSRSY